MQPYKTKKLSYPPEYYLLEKRSKTLVSWWLVGHAWFVVFLAMALVSLAGVAIIACLANTGIIDLDNTKGPLWEFGLSIAMAFLALSACGYTMRWYASKRGSRLASKE
jgi:hypothetical protein